MNYPIISEYVEAIRYAEDNFDKLANLRPVLDDNGNPLMSSGNFAVVFKMRDVSTGRLFAVKCFIKEQEGRGERYAKITEELQFVSSPYILHVQYIDRELFVNTTNCDEEEFPVLVMDWVDGQPLDAYLRENLDDEYALQMLAYRFCNMGAWLLSQPFAHGDLKPDNILVRDDGTLVLVDYDGMYVPSMKGEKANEIGSPDFRHPQRTAADFDEHIDDFSIASIALSLKVISLDSSLYGIHSESDRLLFSEKDYMDFGKSSVCKALTIWISNPEFSALFGIFLLALAKKDVSYDLFYLDKAPQITKLRGFNTECYNKEQETSVHDVYGFQYTKDYHKLIRCTCTDITYTINNCTNVICDFAFGQNHKIKEVKMPDNLVCIGNYAFFDCSSLCLVNLPPNLISLGDYSFCGNSSLKNVIIPQGVRYIGNGAFQNCISLKKVVIPDSVLMIGLGAFSGCKSISTFIINSNKYYVRDGMLISSKGQLLSCWSNSDEIRIPKDITSIGDYAFSECASIKNIHIPNSITKIGNYAFQNCKSLQSLELPIGIDSIGIGAFRGCESLQSLIIPYGVKNIEDYTFKYCSRLQELTIPYGVTNIGNEAFKGCRSIVSIEIPDSIQKIGCETFANCESLQSFYISKSISTIGGGVFNGCKSLEELKIENEGFYEQGRLLISSKGLIISCWSDFEKITLPNDITGIEACAFKDCSHIHFLKANNKLLKIGEKAFSGCKMLEVVLFHNGVDSIDNYAFEGCSSLTEINIPHGTIYNGEFIFWECKSLLNFPKEYEGLESLEILQV